MRVRASTDVVLLAWGGGQFLTHAGDYWSADKQFSGLLDHGAYHEGTLTEDSDEYSGQFSAEGERDGYGTWRAKDPNPNPDSNPHRNS